MRKPREITTAVLLVLLVLLWAGAKIHFHARFWDYLRANDLMGYVVEHWPFSAGMVLIALLFLVIGAIERRRAT